MNPLKSLLILAALFLGVLSRAADEPSKLSGSIGVDYVSQYVFRGVKVADDSYQPTVSLTYGDTYATVWSSGRVGQHLSETDLTLGTAVYGLDVGVTAYTYPNATDTWEPYIGISDDVNSRLNVGAYAFYDAQLKVTTFEGRGTVKVYTGDTISVTLDGSVGHANGRAVSYTYWAVGPTLKYALTKRIDLTLAAQYTSSESDSTHWVGRLGASFSF